MEKTSMMQQRVVGNCHSTYRFVHTYYKQWSKEYKQYRKLISQLGNDNCEIPSHYYLFIIRKTETSNGGQFQIVRWRTCVMARPSFLDWVHAHEHPKWRPGSGGDVRRRWNGRQICGKSRHSLPDARWEWERIHLSSCPIQGDFQLEVSSTTIYTAHF